MAGGLADLLGFKPNPFLDWTRANSNALMGLGAGIASGTDFGEGVSRGLQLAGQGKQADTAAETARKEELQKQAQLNQTVEWMRANAPDLAGMVDAGMPVGEAWAEAMRRMSPQASEQPSTVREWEYFNRLTDDQKGQYLRMKRANPYLDIGTGFVQPDPLTPGAAAGPEIVKDNFTPAYDAAAGAGQAKVDVETQASADSLASKLPGLKTVVDELGQLAKTATYTQTGQLIDNVMRETGREPSEAAVARTKYIAMVDNQVLPLLRDIFGAAFTVKEGETLRATLGAPDKSPIEKQAILEAFIEQKVRDLEALRSRLPAGGSVMPGYGGVAPSSPAGTNDIDAILNGLGI